jgi:hypothetical protein
MPDPRQRFGSAAVHGLALMIWKLLGITGLHACLSGHKLPLQAPSHMITLPGVLEVPIYMLRLAPDSSGAPAST